MSGTDDLPGILRLVLQEKPDDWPAAIDRLCRGKPQLRRRLLSVLAARDDIPHILETDGIDAAVSLLTGPFAAAAAERRTPERIGPYRILDTLGEGGMGTVYLARQETPLRRQVAVKVIKPGMDSRNVIARFEAERQALARMDHRNVATVLDAGTTEDGRPYFVMEYVQGLSITEFCDRHRLSTRNRIELLVQVCFAIHHAHQRGIIHRDIKPTNVLVTEEDGVPRPKVIDFGVAKALDRALEEQSLHTEAGQMIGTLEYMSPEQVRGDSSAIDTTTDVYALGVLLYELLTGTLPFEPRDIRRLEHEAIRRRIAEEDPPLPSRRVGTRGERASEAARQRRTSVAGLTRQIRGDLDWITARAMEKQRSRRYASASELASDLERALRDEAILARPPSAAYAVRKFIRRHRVGVGVSVALAAALIGGTAVATWGMLRARAAESDARRDAATAHHVSTFLEDLFEVSDPGEARGNSITAREILDRGVQRIATELEGQPEVRSRLMGTMGRVYRKLGLYEPALPLLQEAVDLRDIPGDGPVPDSRGALNDLAAAHLELANLDEAKRLLERAVQREDGEGDGADLATSIVNLGSLHAMRGDYEAAAARYEEAMAMRTRLFEPTDASVDDVREQLAAVRLSEGRFRDAISLLEGVLENGRVRYPGGHPAVANAMDDLATAYESVDRVESSEALYREALEMRVRILGEDHAQVADTWNNLGVLLNSVGRHEEARDAHEKGLAGRRAAYGDRHPDVVQSLNNLASTMRKLGDEAAAEALMREALQQRIELLGAHHPDVANSQNNLAQLLQAKGEFTEADTLFARAAHALRESMGPDSPYLAIVLNGLGTTRYLAGDAAGGLEPLQRALAILRAALPEGHPRLAIAHWRLGACLHEVGRLEEAGPHLETALAFEDMPVERRRDLAQRLVSIRDAQGNAAEAARYREILNGTEGGYR